MFTISTGWLCFWVAIIYLIGLVCGLKANGVENLTKEEYAHCVQIIINDDSMDTRPEYKQALINEIQDYACNSETNFVHLSHEARDIVNRSQGIID